jgi:protein involved in polysaccharide export with SLBB domain
MANQTLMPRSRNPLIALVVTIGLATVFVCGPPPTIAKAQEDRQVSGNRSNYHLGPFDQLRLKVVAWRPSQAEVFEWNSVNGEYTIDAGGNISVPLIGEIRASDRTTGELANRVAERLQERLNITQKLDATVEIIKFRPFYIVGDVASSGEYSYRPGMTVIQAMSIAGGLPRSHEMDVHQIERDVVGWTGEMDQLADERTMVNAQIEQQEKLLLIAQQDKQLVDNKQKTGLVTEPRLLAAQRDAATAASELIRLKGRLKEIANKIATNKVLILQSDRIAPTWAGAQLRFSIVRSKGTSFTEMPATETTLVAPGDTIKVKCCGSEAADLSPSAQAESFPLEQAPGNR